MKILLKATSKWLYTHVLNNAFFKCAFQLKNASYFLLMGVILKLCHLWLWLYSQNYTIDSGLVFEIENKFEWWWNLCILIVRVLVHWWARYRMQHYHWVAFLTRLQLQCNQAAELVASKWILHFSLWAGECITSLCCWSPYTAFINYSYRVRVLITKATTNLIYWTLFNLDCAGTQTHSQMCLTDTIWW